MAEQNPLEGLAEAVASGAGLPAIARAAAQALGASVALLDLSDAVLAIADASAEEEAQLLEGADGIESLELRVADEPVGELRYLPRAGGGASPATTRMVSTLLALEVERSRSGALASEEAAADFVRQVLDGSLADAGEVTTRAAELGAGLEGGAGIVIARVAPHSAQAGDWRSRALSLVLRAARAVAPGSLAALEGGEAAEIVTIVPAASRERLADAAEAIGRELAESLSGFERFLSRSRWAADPADLRRAGMEARLAVNVGEAEGIGVLAFEDTGSYRLLLPAMGEDPGELQRFYRETIEPLAAYDDQYETELLKTVEAYLENDGSVAATAEQLYTHRHTIRYRLDRAKELSGHDVTSTEGREKLGLGLKAMRVLGIRSPRGPALEPGTEAGKVRKADDS